MKALLLGAARRGIAAIAILAAAITPTRAAEAAPDDATVKKALEDEMARSLTQLRLGPSAPPYFLRYTVTDSDRYHVVARLGAIVDDDKGQPQRALHAQARVGSADEDNTNFRDAGSGSGATVSREDDYALLRRDLWMLTDREYKNALESMARKKASHATESADKEKVPDFAKAPPVQSVTNRAIVPTDADHGKVKDLVVKLSTVFREFPSVSNGRVDGEVELVRRRLMTSEKTWTDERRSRVRIGVYAETVAEDGQRLSASTSFTSADVAGLASFDKMQAEVRALAKNLADERTAKTVEAGAATVLFEGQAAAQLARLLFVVPFSGQPIPRSAGESAPDGSMSFAEKIGQVVAPTWLSLVDDPTAQGPNKKPLFGGYDTDDEGVTAERVTLIDRGTAKTLLMSRAPRKDLPRSNGHGRSVAGRAMAANLFVNVTGGKDRPALLAAAVRSAGPKGTVYVVRQLGEASGMGRGQTLQARIAFRYKDGKEELVRGLSLEGFVPRKMKKDLIGAGKELVVLDDTFGLPMSIVTPALLFEDVDVGKPNEKNKTPPLYPSPLAAR